MTRFSPEHEHDLDLEVWFGDHRRPFDAAVHYNVEPYVPATTWGPPEMWHPAEGGYPCDERYILLAGPSTDQHWNIVEVDRETLEALDVELPDANELFERAGEGW